MPRNFLEKLIFLNIVNLCNLPISIQLNEKEFLISVLGYLVKPWGARQMEKGKRAAKVPVAI